MLSTVAKQRLSLIDVRGTLRVASLAQDATHPFPQGVSFQWRQACAFVRQRSNPLPNFLQRCFARAIVYLVLWSDIFAQPNEKRPRGFRHLRD